MKISSVSSQIIVLLCFYVSGFNGHSNATLVTTKPSTRFKQITSNFYQTGTFSNINITSGPIVIVDKKTLFIPNLNYDSSNGQARFCVSPHRLIPDENYSEEPLKTYTGQNIYLQLPENMTTDKIEYLGLWSLQNNSDLGHVNLYPNVSQEVRDSIPEALGYHNKTADNKIIYRIPGCCKSNEIINITQEGLSCKTVEMDLSLNVPLYDSNATHLDPDKLLKDIKIIPYYYMIHCPEGYSGIGLYSNDTHGLIYNNSLLYYLDHSDYGILPHGSFCISNRNSTDYLILVCVASQPGNTIATVQNLYFPFLIVSTLCFFASAIVYIFYLKDKNTHRMCFVGYSISMTVTFIALILLQKVNGACNFIGGLFMFSMICSFTWLTCICLDMAFVVKLFNSPGDKKLIYYYISGSLSVPFFIWLCSVIPDGIPDVPASFLKSYSSASMCTFSDVTIAVFFVPIGLMILISVIALGYTSYLINTHNLDDHEFMQKKSSLKFMLIQCSLICLIMTVCYTAWLILNFLNDDQTPQGILSAIILIQYMKGVLIAIILFGHMWVSKKITTRKNKKQENGTYEMVALKDDKWI